jgi:chromatin remodeling complex protein RSC6
MSMSNAVPIEQDYAGTKAARKPNPTLMKPLQLSSELAAVVGSSLLSRPEVVSRIWEYIKGHRQVNGRVTGCWHRCGHETDP